MCWVILLSGVLVAVLSPVSLRSLPGLPFLQLLHPQGVDRLHWVCGEKGDRAEQRHQHKTPPCSKGQTMKKERTITENTTKALPQTSKYPCFPPPPPKYQRAFASCPFLWVQRRKALGLLCDHLADDVGAGRGLLCLRYLWLRVQQLISTRKSLPGVPAGVPALPAADIEGRASERGCYHAPRDGPHPDLLCTRTCWSPALRFMSP